MSIIWDKVKNHNLNNPALPLLLTTWYELVDHNSDGIGLYDRFGLLKSTGQVEKPAYDDFRTRVSEYTW